MNFDYYLPVNISFGIGKIDNLGVKARGYGKKVFIATGSGSAKKSGLLDKSAALLKEQNIDVYIFDKITPNPTTDIVELGVKLLKENNCDFVLGLGGGSILDAAKAIAFMSKNSGDLMDYVYNRKKSDAALPLVLVPTTCGTGSEANGFAVVTDVKTGDKKSLRSNAIISKLSIVDPSLMKTMPKQVLSSVGFDALCHCIEANISKISNPMSKLFSIYAIKLINESLLPLYQGNNDDALWEKMTLASSLGGMSINIAGVAAPHALEHPASGFRNITHGCGLSALSPVIYEKTIPKSPENFEEIAKALKLKNAADLCGWLNNLIALLNLPKTLKQQGVI
ncbi:MAG: iron-containing alcohol dehydrogenase, partial [Endomicrobium sp.]|nr:iron-containing alcohol dehydrogenase [Endomicrobium sp.]